MNFSKVTSTFFKVSGKVARFASKHAPEIALGLGTVSVIAGEVMACRSTLKAEALLEEHKARMDMVHESTEKFDEDTYTETDRKKDTIQVYGETGVKFAKLYAIPTALTAAGFAAIFWGFGILRKRYGLVLGAFAALDARFAEYRGKVIDEYGEEVDQRFAGTLVESNDVTYELPEKIDEDGNVAKPSQIVEARTIDIEALDSDLIGVYSSKTTKRWDASSYLYNEMDVIQIQDRLNRDLSTGRRDHIWLNSQREEFGLPEVASGHMYAKTAKPGAYIDFRPELFYTIFNDEDNDKQFPMTLTVAYKDEYDDNGHRVNRVYDEYDMEAFHQAYIDDPNSVGIILHFDVDTDENGVPVEKFHEIYNIPRK